MARLMAVEMRRCLHRRTTWGLVAIAATGILLMGILLYANTEPAGAPTAFGASDATTFTDLWPHPDQRAEESDGALGAAAFFLLIGAVIGGASMIGAEWEHDTIQTSLTWEPRRIRLLGAKLGAAAGLAFPIALALIALFTLSFGVTVWTKGSTALADAAWLRTYLGAALRLSALAAGAAAFGGALAMIGRRTVFAVGGMFLYMSVLEGILRGLRPRWQPWLLGENLATVVTGGIVDSPADRTTIESTLTLLAYLAALATIAAVVFHRRDIAGTS